MRIFNTSKAAKKGEFMPLAAIFRKEGVLGIWRGGYHPRSETGGMRSKD